MDVLLAGFDTLSTEEVGEMATLLAAGWNTWARPYLCKRYVCYARMEKLKQLCPLCRVQDVVEVLRTMCDLIQQDKLLVSEAVYLMNDELERRT